MNNHSKIYYISQGNSLQEHVENIEAICKAGCKLVQLRLKDFTTAEVLATAKKVLNICNQYNAQLIINDYINVVEQLQSTGLHVGKTDTEIAIARKQLPNTFIGGTANTLEDCIKLNEQKVDYIGLGPLRFTQTKSNLSPVLGIDGYKDILSKLKTLKINTPIYAIGGIVESDIQALLDIGLYGVAISGLLTNQTIEKNKTLINHYE